jgi:hypothetical protein
MALTLLTPLLPAILAGCYALGLELDIADCRLQIADSDCRLLLADCQLPISIVEFDCRFDCRF